MKKDTVWGKAQERAEQFRVEAEALEVQSNQYGGPGAGEAADRLKALAANYYLLEVFWYLRGELDAVSYLLRNKQ